MFQNCDYVLIISSTSLYHTHCILGLVNGGWCFFPLWEKSPYIHQSLLPCLCSWCTVPKSCYCSGLVSAPARPRCPVSLREEGSKEIELVPRTKDWRNCIWDFFFFLRYWQMVQCSQIFVVPVFSNEAIRKFQLDIRKVILKYKSFLIMCKLNCGTPEIDSKSTGFHGHFKDSLLLG